MKYDSLPRLDFKGVVCIEITDSPVAQLAYKLSSRDLLAKQISRQVYSLIITLSQENQGFELFMTSMHDKITNEILPEFAQKLKEEGIISKSDRRPFEFSAIDNLPCFVIKPDRVLYLTSGEKVLVEVINPRDPKRLMGEITYPLILIQKGLISAAYFFVLELESPLTVSREVL